MLKMQYDKKLIIPTKHNGILFRSRTEARWSVFFQQAGIECDYEPDGFETGAGRYLPDFFLPTIGYWFEVKPYETDGKEVDKFKALCEMTGRPGLIAYGPPDGYNLKVFGGDYWDEDALFKFRDKLDNKYELFLVEEMFDATIPLIGKSRSERVAKAYEAARNERFA